MAARNLASGYCFFKGDMEKARHYIQIASTLASRHNIRNFIASTRFIQGYIELLSGNRAKYLREAEVCFSLFNDPLVGESNRLTLRVMNLCYLSMTGDHQNFSYPATRPAKIHRSNDRRPDSSGSLSVCLGQQQFIFSWASPTSSRTFGKRTEHYHHCIDRSYAQPAFAVEGFRSRSYRLCRRSRTKHFARLNNLREKAGGPFYIAFHNILAGAVYTRIKKFEKARMSLEKGLAISQTIPSTYLTICALFNLSYFKYESESPEAALDDLEAGLSLMKINGYNHFWSWEPAMMTKLLSLAVKEILKKVLPRVWQRAACISISRTTANRFLC